MATRGEEHKSGFRRGSKGTETLEFSPDKLGQSYPQQYPHLVGIDSPVALADVLGQPMNIGQVAALLGCSIWTVRQRHLPFGLPHFRIGRTGKLVFYRNQIVRWILEKQKQIRR